MPATMPLLFADSLRAVCREAAVVCRERQGDGAWYRGAFTLEDFRAALALELEMPAGHLTDATCRATLLRLSFVQRRGGDWWVYRAGGTWRTK